MANLEVTDRNDAAKFLKASGAGTNGDPHVPEHLDTNSAALLTAAQAIQTAVEIIDNIVSGSEAQVDIVTSALPTDAATQTTLAALLTELQGKADTAETQAVTGTITAVTDITNVVSVDDNAGSLTVDNTQLSVVGGGTEAAAMRVTIANDSTGVVTVDDGGGALTVDGTVTETNSGAIKTAVELIDNAISGSEMQVDVITSALPTDAATQTTLAALLTELQGKADTAETQAVTGTITAVTDITNVVSVDDNAGSLTVDNAGITTIAGAVSGTEMQVDVITSALPTDAATQTTLAALLTELQGKADTAETQAVTGTITAVTDITNVVSVDDNAGSLTVDNAQLSVVGGGTEAAALRVTIANDSTGVVTVDDGGGALTVDGTVTETNSGAIKTAVELIDNAISGSEMQVDVVAALPAGTNAIGKLAANSGVDIGDVDVTSVPRSIMGPAEPGTAIDSLTSVAVDVAASQTAAELIATPGASKQIWVYGLHFMADTAAGTVLLQDSTPANLTGTMAVSDEGGWVLPLSGNFSMPWFKCATNTALQMDNGACTIDGIITYAIISV